MESLRSEDLLVFGTLQFKELLQNVEVEDEQLWSIDEWKKVSSCFVEAKYAFISVVGN